VIPAGRSPAGLAVDPLRLRAYVALSREDAVEVVDLQQYRAIDRVQLFGGDRPVEVALTPDRNTLLVVNGGSDSLSLVDVTALSESARIPVGQEPSSVIVDGTGRRAYVFNTLSGSVSVVDLTIGEVMATIATDPEPVRGQLNRRGDRLYVIHRSSPHLTVVDTTSLATLDRVYVGIGATAVKVDPVTDRIYLARSGALEIEIYDPFSLLPVDSIPVPGEVAYMTIDDEGNNLAVVLPEQREIRVLRLVGKETVARVDVGEHPCRAAFLGER
jgi:YVTN family beta-propeller protein